MNKARRKYPKKTARRLGIVLLVFALFFTGLHFFLVYRAGQILNYIVYEVSGGSYKVHSQKISFRYRPLSITASRLTLYPVDSIAQQSYYVVRADTAFVEVSKVWSLIRGNNVDLANVRIVRPNIKIYNGDTSAAPKKSLNEALGDIQHSLIKSLSAFHVTKCKIEDAQLTYIQNRQHRLPFAVNHMFLQIDSLHEIGTIDSLRKDIQFAAYIKFFLDRPDITFPDPDKHIYIQNLLLDTRRKVFSVNRFNLYQKNDVGTIDSINLSNIHVRHFNWGKWLSGGVVEIDTLQAFNGSTFFDFSNKELFALKDSGKKKSKVHIDIPLVIHNVEISKIRYGLMTGFGEGSTMIQLNGDSLAIKDFALTRDANRPLQIGGLAFKVSAFSTNNDYNNNESSFERLIIDHNNLELINYNRVLGSKKQDKSSIAIPSLKVVDFSLDELLKYRLKASRLVLDDPSLVIDIQQTKQKKDADKIIGNIAASIEPSLDIKQLSIHNATVILLPKDASANKLSINNLNTDFDANRLLRAASVMDVINAATLVSSGGFHITGSNIDMDVERAALIENNNGVYISRVNGSFGTGVKVDLHGLKLVDRSERFDVTKLQHIYLDDLEFEEGIITVDNTKSRDRIAASAKAPLLDIDKLRGGPVRFQFTKGNQRFSFDSITVSGNNIHFDNGFTKWDNLAVNSDSVIFKNANHSILASGMTLQQPGMTSFRDVTYLPKSNDVLRRLFIPELQLTTQYTSTAIDKIDVQKLQVIRPMVDVFLAKKQLGQPVKPVALPTFTVAELNIDQPAINLTHSGKGNQSFYVNKGTISLTDVNSDSLTKMVTASALSVAFQQPIITIDSTWYYPGAIDMHASGLAFNGKNKAVSAMVDSAVVSDFQLELSKRKLHVTNGRAGIYDYAFATGNPISGALLFNTAFWKLGAEKITRKAPNNMLTIYNQSASSHPKVLRFDSLEFVPVLGRDSFFVSTNGRKGYNTIHAGHTELHNWDIDSSGEKRKFLVDHMYIDQLHFLTEKDKTRESDTVDYKPLLARSLEGIPLKFNVDTISLTNASVDHNVLTTKVPSLAHLDFANIHGDIYNLHNTPSTNTDTLGFLLHTSMMNNGNLQVGFRQSYLDSMQTFILRAKLENMDLSSLNSFLVPLVGVKINRGFADSMRLAVKGDDQLAIGSMDLRYHNLRLSLLKKGEGEYFLSKFYNWLLNLLVRSSDNSRSETIYLERMRGKAIFNYWGRIAVNGLLSNLGLKREKRLQRKYRKATNSATIPVIPD